jgi:hypothetical protein
MPISKTGMSLWPEVDSDAEMAGAVETQRTYLQEFSFGIVQQA